MPVAQPHNRLRPLDAFGCGSKQQRSLRAGRGHMSCSASPGVTSESLKAAATCAAAGRPCLIDSTAVLAGVACACTGDGCNAICGNLQCQVEGTPEVQRLVVDRALVLPRMVERERAQQHDNGHHACTAAARPLSRVCC